MAPQLRGLLASNLKRDFTIATTIGVIALCAYKFGVQLPRRRRYEEFYKNFDSQKEFERLKNVGVYTSVQPNGEPGTGW